MFQFIQILYWLGLSTWFGGVLFIAVAAPVIHRTIGDFKPVLPTVLSVNLENQHGTLLAGTIVANLLNAMIPIQLICAGAVLIGIGGQWFLVDHSGNNLVPPILRSAMFLAAAVLVIYDWRIVWPRLRKYRDEYLDNADEPDVANPAKDQFDRYHQESVSVLRNVLFLLLGIILFSADIRPSVRVFSSDSSDSSQQLTNAPSGK